MFKKKYEKKRKGQIVAELSEVAEVAEVAEVSEEKC